MNTILKWMALLAGIIFLGPIVGPIIFKLVLLVGLGLVSFAFIAFHLMFDTLTGMLVTLVLMVPVWGVILYKIAQ
jgi:hypothetical protein